MTIEVQCTSCHTRYRIDEQVLPEGTPTFKCSRCGHVFTLEPRSGAVAGPGAPAAPTAAPRAPRSRREARPADPASSIGEKSVAESDSGWVADSGAADRPAPARRNQDVAPNEVEESAPAAPAAAPPASGTANAAATPAEEKRPSTDELLSKPFRDEESTPGENLKFDFNDDHLSENPAEPETPKAAAEVAEDRHSGDWQVGETEFETPAARADATVEVPPAAPAPRARRAAAQPKPPVKAELEEFVDEDAAPLYNQSVATHSARFFVAMFALMALGYGVMTVLIRSAPATAAEMLSHLPKIGDRFIPPVAPARLVAMRDVHADYLRTKGGHMALVVTGIAENVGDQVLHTVQIAADLRDAAQHALTGRAVYCGNNLSAPMVTQMTPHELEFFQKLDAPKSFALAPSETSPFVIVFIDPPAAVNGFEVSVASASADSSATPPADTGG